MGQKYTTQAVSAYNASPPSDDSSQTDQNKVKWSTHKTKIGDPLFNAITAIDSALVTRFDEAAQLKTAGYTTTLADHAKLIEVTGTNTMLLLDASTGGASYQINILNTGVAVVTVGRSNAANTINGVAGNWTLNPGNGASFRVNSTLNGYHVIATALATGVGLTDVLHTTGSESKSGSLTFTSDTSIILSAVNPILEGRNTANAQYRWRVFLPNSDNKIYFQHNTHASGDFSTNVNALNFNETTMNYTGTIVAAAAALSTELVTKAQLDAKVYGGRIANNGTASVTYGPSGWTVSRTAAGTVVITHNLGTTNYTIVASPYLASFRLTPSVINANDVTIITWNTADVAQDSGFNFTLARN